MDQKPGEALKEEGKAEARSSLGPLWFLLWAFWRVYWQDGKSQEELPLLRCCFVPLLLSITSIRFELLNSMCTV